jgi:hypothetical protein
MGCGWNQMGKLLPKIRLLATFSNELINALYTI